MAAARSSVRRPTDLNPFPLFDPCLQTTTPNPTSILTKRSSSMLVPSLVALATAMSTLTSATPISTSADAASVVPEIARSVAPLLSHAVDMGKDAIEDSYSQSFLPSALPVALVEVQDGKPEEMGRDVGSDRAVATGPGRDGR